MRLLKIVCPIVMNCAYWTKIGIKNCGKQFFVKFKHEQANMVGNKIEKF